MKRNHSAMKRKLGIAAISVAAVLSVLPFSAVAVPETIRPEIQRKILSTLRQRVELLVRLTADSEKQYKNGSLDGLAFLRAQMELYQARLLLMKAEMGLPPEAGIAVAAVDFYVSAGHAEAVQTRFSGGNLSLYLYLTAQLKANEAQMLYLNWLSRCENPAVMETARKKLPRYEFGKPLADSFLRELLTAEIKACPHRSEK